MASKRHVLVTGASGYIGSAVARSFVKAGWKVLGLVRRQDAFPELENEGIQPILGSRDDLSWLPNLYAHAPAPEVIVSVTENIADYFPHFNNIVTMLRSISEKGAANGIRPLVLFTSGCKDCGRTGLDGDSDLKFSTEDGPMNPPPFAHDRATGAIKIFEHKDLFDAVLLRPTTVYGLTSSFYSDAFTRGEEALKTNGNLQIPSYRNSIAHGCHVDSCGDAYVALAENADRSAVAGQIFNISGNRYETAEEIADALVKEYSLKGVEYKPDPGTEDFKFADMLFAFSQAVSSEKIRKLTGWTDTRPLFSEGISLYRQEYELARSRGDFKVLKSEKRLAREGTGQNAFDTRD